jgi:hypothetical protein
LTYGEQFTNIIANLQVFAATAEKSEKSGSEAGEQRGYSHMFAPLLSYLIRGVIVLRPFTPLEKCGID